MSDQRNAPATEFALRLTSIDALFNQYDARPVADRVLNDDVHAYLLDEWEGLRDRRPSTLTVYAPVSERAHTDENAVRAAIRSDLGASRGPLRSAGPLSRRERNALWIGIGVFVASVVLSTTSDRLSGEVLVQAVSQGLVLLGWVALWLPAAHFVTEVLPHYFNRRRYAEFADIEIRIRWV
jgi:hypothetical protein